MQQRLCVLGGFEKIRFGFGKAAQRNSTRELRAGRELGDSFSAFRDSVLGKFSRKHEADRRLNFAAAERRLFVVGSKLSSLGSNTLKDVIDKGVHDRHTLLGDTGIRVDLLEHLVDVAAVRLRALLRLLGTSGFLGWGGFCRLLGWCLGHGCELLVVALVEMVDKLID